MFLYSGSFVTAFSNASGIGFLLKYFSILFEMSVWALLLGQSFVEWQPEFVLFLVFITVREFEIEQWRDTFSRDDVSSMQPVFWSRMSCSTWPLTLISVFSPVWLMCRGVACRKIPRRNFPLIFRHILTHFYAFITGMDALVGGFEPRTWEEEE